jgi:predicted transcriptional regulator
VLEHAVSTAITLPDDLHAQVQALAETTGRPLEAVLAEAVAQGLAYDRWFRAEVETGMRSAAQGPLIPAEEVWKTFLQRGLLSPEAIDQVEAEADVPQARA